MPSLGILADRITLGIPNTPSKNRGQGDIVAIPGGLCEGTHEQLLGFRVKFVVELMIMRLRMTLRQNSEFVIVAYMENAYKEILREVVLRRHMEHRRLNGLVPYLREKNSVRDLRFGRRTPPFTTTRASYRAARFRHRLSPSPFI